MAGKTVQAGDSIVSKCNRCKELRDHAVVAMVDGEIAKVQCKVCGSVHKHRAASAKPKKTGRAAASRPAKALKQVQQALQEWETAVNGRTAEDAKPYGGEGADVEGGLINHAAFGLGVVERLVSPTKMEVLFKNGRKLMMRSV